MHARFNQSAVAESGRGIRGTFYPSEGSPGAGSIGPALAKIGVVLLAMAVFRGIVGHGGRHGGESRRSRRRGMIAELHRELHAEEASQAEAPAKA
jgi:hypothetical protein